MATETSHLPGSLVNDEYDLLHSLSADAAVSFTNRLIRHHFLRFFSSKESHLVQPLDILISNGMNKTPVTRVFIKLRELVTEERYSFNISLCYYPELHTYLHIYKIYMCNVLGLRRLL